MRLSLIAKIATCILLLCLAGCVSQRVSVIEGSNYNANKNCTEYFVLPYGAASIPGKWTKGHHNNVSGQQFFTNADSVEIALAFNAYNKYEFNANGAHKNFEFVKTFYEWDSNYFVSTYGLSRAVVEQDSVNKYLIWRLFGTYKGSKFDTYLLFGEKAGNTSNFSVSSTNKWTDQDKIKFLKGLFLPKS